MTTTEHEFDLRGWLRDPVGLLSFAGIAAGLAGLLISERDGFVALFFAGVFGPTLLRELGLLRWRDEFQRETTTRAALHAFLGAGAFLAAVMSLHGFTGTYDAGGKTFQDALPASTVVILLATVWYLSRLLQYWGPVRAAVRIWTAFSCTYLVFWIVVVVAVSRTQGNVSVPQLALNAIFCLVPLILALVGRRLPRVAGVVALVLVGWFVAAGFRNTTPSTIPWELYLDILLLIVAPLAAPAVALVFSGIGRDSAAGVS